MPLETHPCMAYKCILVCPINTIFCTHHWERLPDQLKLNLLSLRGILEDVRQIQSKEWLLATYESINHFSLLDHQIDLYSSQIKSLQYENLYKDGV